MADTITRCPKCHTSFRITDAHLKSAKGAVRCGSCLNIFNAKAHLVAAAEPPPPGASRPLTNKPKAATAKPAAPAPAAEKPKAPVPKPAAKPESKPAPGPAAKPKAPPPPPPADDDDDILISDDMPLEDHEPEGEGDDFDADFNDNILYSKSLGSQESNLFERELIDEGDDDEEKSDESWALSLLENQDEEEVFPQLRKDTGVHEAVPDEDDRDDTGYLHQAIEDTGFQDDYENMDTDALQEELREEIRRTGIHEPVFTSAEPSLADLEAIVDPDYDYNRDSPSGGKQQYIHAIEPEPVEFSYRRDYPFLHSNLLWGPLAVLMLVALFGLVGWLQFPHLNKIEPYRGYYAVACSFIGCELPPLVDRKEIRAVNLVVRSHPKMANALVVDAVLQNAAPFPQAFPALDLVFTDARNKAVAARRFMPRDYLGGEMAGKSIMPSEQPVHIALEIVDPGPQAVGYRIEIAN